MRYSNSVVTEEDFRREREIRDNNLLARFAKKLNGRWQAYVNGFDSDYIPNPPRGMNE